MAGGAILLAFAGPSCFGPTEVDRTGLRVVLISLDGLRPDAVNAANTPTLMRMAKDGAATLKAQTGVPSLTLPSHTSMVTGLVPARHGINWNDDTLSGHNEKVAVPTIFDIAAQAGFTSAMFVGKSKLSPIVHAGAPTRVTMPPVGAIWKSDTVAARMLAYLMNSPAEQRPNMMFIHIPDIDIVGHADGWMTPQYIDAVQHADSVVDRIWVGLKLAYGQDLVVIVTADHGGFDRGHSDDTNPLAKTIPWIAWGKGVTPQILSTEIRVVDAGPTMLWVLGLTPPSNWDGVPVKSAFPGLKR